MAGWREGMQEADKAQTYNDCIQLKEVAHRSRLVARGGVGAAGCELLGGCAAAASWCLLHAENPLLQAAGIVFRTVAALQIIMLNRESCNGSH